MQTPRVLTVVALAFAALAAPGLGRGQDQDPPAFSSRSELVVLNAVVTDQSGRPVSGLSRDAFVVLEDGRSQPVTFFNEMDAPVTLSLLVDASGSMRRNGDQIAAAAEAFALAGHRDDEFVAFAFNEEVTSLMPEGSPFTNNASILRDALASGLAVRGRTALYDALVDGVRAVSNGRHQRKVIVVLSDGGDNASVHSFNDAMARVEASQVIVYAVSIVDHSDSEANPKQLEKLARASGGLAFRPSNIAEVGGALARINDDIRSGYALAYEPSVSRPGAPPHRLQVYARAPRGSRYSVRSRTTYRAEIAD